MDRPLTGIRADGKQSYRSIERLAVGLRQKLSLGPMDYFDALKFFQEIVPEMTVQCRAGTIHLCDAVDDCPHEGQTRWDQESNLLEVALSGPTYARLQEGHPRARYTVAHEAGHACLHTDQIIRLGGMDVNSQVALHRERIRHDACQDTEWQANAFASAVLMPAEGVERLFNRLGRVSAHALTETFGVSLECATYRIETYERSLGR